MMLSASGIAILSGGSKNAAIKLVIKKAIELTLIN
jgi:hypothetical protein